MFEGADGEPLMLGVWNRFKGKNLVWYPKDGSEAVGYEIPETWDDMIALSDQIVVAADTPCCIVSESGTATIATTAFGDVPLPRFESPPRCWLHKQGNFITTLVPAPPRCPPFSLWLPNTTGS